MDLYAVSLPRKATSGYDTCAVLATRMVLLRQAGAMDDTAAGSEMAMMLCCSAWVVGAGATAEE